jgi:protein-arginine kinase activator protein McsA
MEPSNVLNNEEDVKMEQKQYLDKLMQSFSHFIKEETMRGIEGNTNHKLLYRFGDLQEVRLEGFNKQTKFAEQRTLYEIIQERIETTQDQELTETEAKMLYKEIQASINFAARNLEEKRYREAMQCSQRASEDARLILQYVPELEETLKNPLQIAEQTIRTAKTLWQNPEKGKLILKLEEFVATEQYEKAAKIRDQINSTGG